MKYVSLVEAEANLSELVERAAAGELICITLRGKPIVQLSALASPPKPVDIARLRAVTERLPVQTEPAGEFVRRMRDEDRY